MYWTLEKLIQHCNEVTINLDGKWFPARPYPGNLAFRIYGAWEVLMGRADAVKWPGDQ